MQRRICSLSSESPGHAAGYNSGTFSDPDSPSLGAWLEALPANIKAEGLGVANVRQNNTNRVAGLIAQGPRPIADLDTFRASVIKPPQHAVKLTHRYQLSQQEPKVCRSWSCKPRPLSGSWIKIGPNLEAQRG